MLPFQPGSEDQVIRVIGGADDLEYFDNPDSGQSPDDWYRIKYSGDRPKLLTANLQMPEPVVSARIRVYQPGVPTAEELKPREAAKREDFGNSNVVPYIHPDTEAIPGPEPVYSYYDGRDVNERIHQQDDNFRSFVTRRLHPGGTYFLRVEANQPGYELEVRFVDPAPFATPRQALEQSIYYHLAEIDAWLIHRPRNIAVHRRVRDGSSLFGENCMSCHTQSGVWGVADAMRHGYRPDGTIQNHRRLVNTMYESLRPTNHLVDAAVNTSLAPNDLGDAPAGSRVAGPEHRAARTHVPAEAAALLPAKEDGQLRPPDCRPPRHQRSRQGIELRPERGLQVRCRDPGAGLARHRRGEIPGRDRRQGREDRRDRGCPDQGRGRPRPSHRVLPRPASAPGTRGVRPGLGTRQALRRSGSGLPAAG